MKQQNLSEVLLKCLLKNLSQVFNNVSTSSVLEGNLVLISLLFNLILILRIALLCKSKNTQSLRKERKRKYHLRSFYTRKQNFLDENHQFILSLKYEKLNVSGLQFLQLWKI